MVRIYISFVFFFFFSLLSSAGNGSYLPLLEEGKVWNYEYSYVDYTFNRVGASSKYWVEGDTIVDGRRLYRLCYSSTEDDKVFRQLWYEEDGRVYACNAAGTPQHLVYDFTLSPGDKITRDSYGSWEYGDIEVVSTDTVSVRGYDRKRLRIRSSYNDNAAWVEGIGNPGRLDEPVYHMVSDGRDYRLVSCYVGDECVFESGDFDGLLPAQDIYSDMLAEGKTWKFIRWPSGNTHQKGMRGDTIVNGLTCKKYGYVNGDGTFGCTSIFRQDGDKIYSLNFNTGEFYLTYDFGAKMGDVITIGLARIEVTGTDVITARDHELRRISFKVIEEYDDNGWTEIQGNYGGGWIEGIGGSTGPESQIPTPRLTGNYDMMLDISLGDELFCDSYIFQGQYYEKMLLSYMPKWTYIKQAWDEGKGEWREPVECHAMKTGAELPSPKNFPYIAVTIEEEKDSKLLLRNGDVGQVLAERASYLEYISKVFPEIDDVFTELAYYPLDVVLYDFTLEVGDRYPCKGEVYVSGVSHMTTRDGVERKVLFLSNGLEIVEGIGCLNSPDGPFAYQNSSGCESMKVSGLRHENGETPIASLLSLHKYGEGTAPIYVKGDELTSILQNSIIKRNNSKLYDLTGRRLTTPPTRGIYIQNGQKIVVR